MTKKIRLLFFVISILFLPSALYADMVHVLAKGETLYSLARYYGVSLESILQKNGISDPSALPVGTRLLIPSSAVETETSGSSTYTVKKGDTYYGIARKFGISVDELLTVNSRDASVLLKVGEKLKIRQNTETVSVSGSGRTEKPAPAVESAASFSGSSVSIPMWPVSGTKVPLEGKLDGVAILADPGSYVYSVSAGSVVWTGPYRGFGEVALVNSNGYIYLYGGNEDLFVNVGERVKAGTRIGRLSISASGKEKKRMIFSVFRDGVPVEPEKAPRG